MNVTTRINQNKTGASVTARSGNRRVTLPVDKSLPEAAAHGEAAKALVTKVVPGYRRSYVLNTVKVVEAIPGKTVYKYAD